MPGISNAGLKGNKMEFNSKTSKDMKEAEIEKSFAEEIMFFGIEQLDTSRNRLLHSIAASSDGQTIDIHDTIYKRYMPEPTSTQDIKGTLSFAGFQWNEREKRWEIPYSEKNVSLVVSILRDFATKAEPVKLGLRKCWECGRWCNHSELDRDSYCGC